MDNPQRIRYANLGLCVFHLGYSFGITPYEAPLLPRYINILIKLMSPRYKLCSDTFRDYTGIG